MSERMRKRRAFADRDLDAVMFQREQQAAEIQRLSADIPIQPGWNPLHPIRFPVLPFQLFQTLHPPVIKIENKEDEESDIEVDVTSHPPSPQPSNSNKSKISFSVESIIGRP